MLLEDILKFGIPLFLIWQVVVPVIRDRPTFPLFRRKSAGLKQALRAEARRASAEDLAEAARIEAEARRIETQVNKSRTEE